MFSTLEAALREYNGSGSKDIKINDYPSQILCLM